MKAVRALRHFVTSSLSRKMVLSVLFVHCLLIGMVTWEVIGREAEALEEQRLERAEGVASILARSGEPWMLSEDLAGLGELVDTASSIGSTRYAMFVNTGGRVLAHTDHALVGRFVDVAGGRSLPTDRPNAQQIARTSTSIDAAAPVRVNGQLVGWAWVSVSLGDIRVRQRDLAISALGFGAAAVLLGLFIAYATARNVTRRLDELAAVTDRFRVGDHSVRVNATGSDEVAATARGINEMLKAVDDSERSLQDAQRIAHLGTWRHDPAKPNLDWSEAVYELFGLDPLGPPPTFAQFLAGLQEHQRTILLRLVEAGDHDEVSSFTLDVTRPDGTQRVCWVEARLEIDPETGTRVLFGICQDITERETAAAQLRQAQKMEAVGQLTGGLAHDFNNLLAIIIGNLDLLQETNGEGPGQEFATEALDAALRGSELTKQLLAFSRRQPLAPQSIDLNQLISGVATLIRRTVGESIDVRVHLATDLWVTNADPSQVESAVLNLVINARDAMTGGGAVTIETRNLHCGNEDGAESRDAEISPGDYSVITVSDTGNGMAPDIVAHAFEPFFTTKPVGQGSGLGLSMIYGFAKQSGGHVKIYSEPGHGTAVRLFLPRAEGADSPKQEQAVPAPLPASAGETILLAEDNAGVRRVTARQLAELGYDVLTAQDSAEALVLLSKNPQIELLFTDVVMPGGMNGIELADQALRANPGLKVLHASGFTEAAIKNHTGMAGIRNLLSKPYRKDELAAKVRAVLDSPASRIEAAL